MMTHHVITILLMAWSYFYNFTRAGCLIIVIMDYCDIFLPVSDPSIISTWYLIKTIAGQNVSLPSAEQAL
jgi:TLC domain